MHIPFSQTTKVISPEATIWDYLINSQVGISYQKLSGRGPKTGRYLNTICHEIYFITQGSAVFYVGDAVYTVGEKDVVVVEPNTPHYIQATEVQYITITRPDWYPEQYQQV